MQAEDEMEVEQYLHLHTSRSLSSILFSYFVILSVSKYKQWLSPSDWLTHAYTVIDEDRLQSVYWYLSFIECSQRRTSEKFMENEMKRERFHVERWHWIHLRRWHSYSVNLTLEQIFVRRCYGPVHKVCVRISTKFSAFCDCYSFQFSPIPFGWLATHSCPKEDKSKLFTHVIRTECIIGIDKSKMECLVYTVHCTEYVLNWGDGRNVIATRHKTHFVSMKVNKR